MRPLLLPLPSIVLLSAACNGGGTDELPTIVEDLPSADLSTVAVDFGELDFGGVETRQLTLRNGGDLPMGVSDISLMADGMEQNFFVSWNPDAMTCPEADAPAEDEADAKGLETDTWDGGDGSGGDDGGGSGGGSDTGNSGGSSGGGGGGGGGGGTVDNNTVMDPGCELPIIVTYAPVDLGEAHAALRVDTVTHVPAKEDADPEYYRDPDNFHRVVMLKGSAVQGVGNIVVRSPNVDMGHHYTGETSQEYVYIHNVGDGDLSFDAPALCRAVDCATYDGPHTCVECTEDQDPCDDAFTIDTTHLDGTGRLPGGSATFFEVDFTPTDLDPAFCELTIQSDDGDTPTVRVKVKGNAGSDPENQVPSVQVVSPPVGYVHHSADPLPLEIDMFDVNQPADTLICKVRSLLGETKVADCAASDESGRVHVEIPIELLETGTDTLLVTVTDQAENRASASTTIVWKASYPPGDDDGDGWGDDPDDVYVDCDDNDPTVYPSAAELPDGKDNDCDGAVDEKTVAGDDDGDSVTELEGDCDDNDPTTYPGAIERPDQKDNNCDGEVDEYTSVHDDDGDGFAELDLDCDDNNPDVNPAAVELCDDIDNNCDGFVDEAGCISITSEPIIVGGIQMAANAIGVGQSTTMTAFVYDADGQDISYQWQEDSSLQSTGHSAISDAQAQTITWTAPAELPGDAEGAIFDLGVIIQDEDGQQAWVFGEITVYADPVATSIERADLSAQNRGGCGGSDEAASTDTAAAAALGIPLLGLFAAARRRREND